MNELVRELNIAIGALRAMQDYISEETKLFVDNRLGLPIIIPKDGLLGTLKKAEVACDKVVCHLSGYPWVERDSCRDGCKIKKAVQNDNSNLKETCPTDEQEEFLASRDADEAGEKYT
jgi:hypothetical protein